MKKNIFSALVLALSMVGLSASAQNPSTTRATSVCPEVCQQATACPVQAPCNKKAYDQKRPERKSPFADLNLNADQQKKIDTINEQYRGSFGKKDRKDKENRLSREEMREKAKANRQEYLRKVKEVLTPEQYTQFLENSYSVRPGRHHKGEGRGFKGLRDGKRGYDKNNCPVRNAQCAPVSTQTTNNTL